MFLVKLAKYMSKLGR